MDCKIFYSWQSDLPNVTNRSLIEDAINGAIADLRKDQAFHLEAEAVLEPVLDRDTVDVAGAPDIGATIFAKVDAAAVFVGDVSIVEGSCRRPSPNPNVLLETGWAGRSLGWGRVVLVMNTAFGRPEELPFDLRQKRVTRYELKPEGEKALVRKQLRSQIAGALRASLIEWTKSRVVVAKEFDVKIDIGFIKVQPSSGDEHSYELNVFVKNIGSTAISEFDVKGEFPALFMHKQNFGMERSDQAHDGYRVFRHGNQSVDAILPGDSRRVMPLPYHVTKDLFFRYSDKPEFENPVSVEFYVGGKLIGSARKAFRLLQNF